MVQAPPEQRQSENPSSGFLEMFPLSPLVTAGNSILENSKRGSDAKPREKSREGLPRSVSFRPSSPRSFE